MQTNLQADPSTISARQAGSHPNLREPSPLQGLSLAEVQRRRAAGQGNAAPLGTTRSYGQILRENVFTFINNVLFGLGIALVLLGRVSDALVSVGVVLANTVVSVAQEIRAKRTLDRVALLTRPKATVIREGTEQVIDPDEIVLGDVLVARPGDQIVVDGQVLGEGRMELDESLLTGESDLVEKDAGDPVYSGSFCVSGTAHYEAQKVGADKLAHQISASARAFRRVMTPLQEQINLVVRVILLLVVYFELLLVVDAVFSQLSIVESVRMSVVIAGLVPNGLFLAISTAYALGALRMVGQGALVQQSNAVESLSHVDVLCMDKTGTITANRLKLESIQPLQGDESHVRALLADYAASVPAGNRTNEALQEALPGAKRAIYDEVPFSSDRKWSALVFEDGAGDSAPRGVYVLGAPEMIAGNLHSQRRDGWQDTAGQWASAGRRVLLFAHLPAAESLRDASGDPHLPRDLEPLAVVGLSDELRMHVRETLGEFSRAGIALKVISGDNPQTVGALARQVGLEGNVTSVSGLDLAKMDPAQLALAAEESTVFGRITPQQKERLVSTLQARGHYVAIIGDGVNDVLALKRANVGVAMQSGSQATRSVADLILLNDTFASLPYAFREGQRIINGMQDILKLFMTRVLYAALLIVSTSAVGGFPFSPKQNSLLTLFTVGLPTLALAAWAQPGLKPRRDLVRNLMHFVLPAAFTLLPIGMGVFVYYLAANGGDVNNPRRLIEFALPVAQSALTTFSIMCGLLLLPFAEPPVEACVGGDEFSGDWRPTWLAAGLFLLYLVVLTAPGLREFFELEPLSIPEFVFLALLAVAWVIILRAVWRARLLERFLGFDRRS